MTTKQLIIVVDPRVADAVEFPTRVKGRRAIWEIGVMIEILPLPGVSIYGFEKPRLDGEGFLFWVESSANLFASNLIHRRSEFRQQVEVLRKYPTRSLAVLGDLDSTHYKPDYFRRALEIMGQRDHIHIRLCDEREDLNIYLLESIIRFREFAPNFNPRMPVEHR